MKQRTLSRRTLLRGLGGVAVGLPFLGAMADSARATAFPKRFVVFFTGLGTVRPAWIPTGTETDFTFGPILAPLEPFKKKTLVLEGVDYESAYHGPGDPHQQGIGHALTGTELQEGSLFPYACNPGKMVGWAGGISLDQFLADKLGQTTRFPSLEFGVQVQYANVSARISYRGPGQPVPPEDDPYQAYTRIFSDLGTDPEALARLRAQRKTVLDAVTGDYNRLSTRLGASDRMKVDAHLEAVREIEKRLDAPGVIGGSCNPPVLGAPVEPLENDNYPEIAKTQLDLLAMSLICDLTRVASIQWTTVQTGKVFSWLGQDEPHHTLSHSSDSDTKRQQALIDIGHWHAQQLAYLCQKLDSVPEGDGTVLDNTVILWCSDIAQGNTHARRDVPLLVLGGAGGALRTGRHLKYAGAYHNDLLIAISHAMGVPVTTFGNPLYCNGPLSGLLV
ncbi:DUF1552 domain-containing protein [Polyangium mundeleinium]|uniref:DUF1552 domain-containing protein n=1 Tax=Polyangium mundeleinium TaxID=2995306 RepID=A0ABT5F1V5_9BACT|nr:DUF1552 domain-containing protein [Polyangium mundeleinium]MDC0747579.1 DUF1552 domain-containing protein [Polyangium mundeleinium]